MHDAVMVLRTSSAGASRLKEIFNCCDQMEIIRKARKMPPEELSANGWDLFGCEIGELDMWEEIHRLLYEWSAT